MADSFFEFNTSLTTLELVDEPDLDEEEEYDALNDETFGTDAYQGDWEEDHTRFAEVAENSRTYRNSFNSDKDDDLDLVANLSHLVLESEEEREDEIVDSDAKNKDPKSVNIFNRFPLDCVGDYNSSTWSPYSDSITSKLFNKQQEQSPQLIQPRPSVTQFLPSQLSKIPTVQELERDLMQKNKQKKGIQENKNKDGTQIFNQEKNQSSNTNNQLQNLIIQQQNALGKFSLPAGSNKYPPGFGPVQQSLFNQPQQEEMVMLRNNQNMPMQLPLILPPQMQILYPPTMFPLLLSQNPRMVKPHPMMRFMPSHPLLMKQQQQQFQQHFQKQQGYQKLVQNKMQNHQDFMKNGQASQNHQNTSQLNHPWMHNPNRRNNENYDEYAGLMNNRERQWLLNIQIIQLASDKPHVDDYYYMVWSKKQEKAKKLNDTRNGMKNEKQIREPYFANNRIHCKNDLNRRERRDSDREITATPSPRVYVPLQFENSLGKLQCGSVTAPRKIIDLDIVPERQVESSLNTNPRDSKKTKKILLELEMLYLLTMDVEDLDKNITPQTKQPEETSPSKPKLLEQIMTNFLNEDRFVNFMCIRKGKNLLLRILSHLNFTDHSEHLTNLWCRLFKSVSVIIRRDQNDGILLQIYPYFKQWINTVDCTVLSILASYLLTANVPVQGKKSSRAVSPTPGKSVLNYILTTTFGVSTVSSILCRGESLFPALEEKQKQDWTSFLLNFIKHMINFPNVENIPAPLDPLPANVISVILNRSTGLQIQDYASAKRILTAFNKDKSCS